MESACVSASVSNGTTKQSPEEKQNEIFNPNLEVDLDSEIIYKSIPVNVHLDDVPREKIFPPPLTRRPNIELEYLFANRNINVDNNRDNRDNRDNTNATRSLEL